MRRRLYDAERYEVLAAVYPQEELRVKRENIGAYRTKVTRAGDFLYISCYPLITAVAREDQETRIGELDDVLKERKNIKLRTRWNRYNNARRVTEFEQLVHANFVPGDLHVSCTYAFDDWDKGGPPEGISRQRAKADVHNYLRRVKRLLKRNDVDMSEFRWICVTVTKEGVYEAAKERPDRHHHHLLMHGVPESLRNEVERLWGMGYCNADRIQDDKNTGIARMAGYVARQEGSANGERSGERSYTCSRNIIRPTVTVSDAKVSIRRVCQIAADVRVNGKEILEKIWKGYRVSEEPVVRTSDFVAGAYIWARLRKEDSTGKWAGQGRSGLKSTGSARRGT